MSTIKTAGQAAGQEYLHHLETKKVLNFLGNLERATGIEPGLERVRLIRRMHKH